MRMRPLLLCSLLLSGLLLADRSASAQQDPATRAAWNQPVKPFRIVGNVYYVGVAGVSSFLIATPEGQVLHDGGRPQIAPHIRASIAARGFRLADVKYLLNSHAHFDHAGGLAELKRLSGGQLVASRGDQPVLAAGRQEANGATDAALFPAVKVDRVIDDGATVRLGGSVLTAHLTPGHTKGCTTWTLPVTEDNKTYQVLFHCSTTVPGYRLVNNPLYPQIVADYRRSFAALRRLRCDVLLAPHGSFFDLDGKRAKLADGGRSPKTNPFVNPAEFGAFVNESEHDFNAELERQLKAAR
jgi:metallo-beta-lactamase class B